MRTRSPVRTAAASKLRSFADRLAPLASAPSPVPPAPLVRLGGRWWYREELLSEPGADGPAVDGHLRP